MFMEDTELGPLPTVLNLGAGDDFRPEAFNVDSDGAGAPDAVLDLGAIDLGTDGIALITDRFGTVRLRPGHFQRIHAGRALARAPDIIRLMTTCLRLLRIDGTLAIAVPHDLSYGAWEDPTHVRAFNERSWTQFTDRYAQLGWTEARFTADAMHFVPSPFGEELRARGVPRDEIVRTPRAIDGMVVGLRKTALTLEERAACTSRPARRAPIVPPPAPRPAVAAARPAGPKPFAGPWSAAKDRYCIWIVSPKDYTHHHAFDDVAAALSEAFAARGGSAPVVTHPSAWQGRTPIVLAPQLLTPNLALILPPGSILYNMEQVDRGSAWMSPHYLSLLKRHPVLDYSHRNAAALQRAGVGHAAVLPVGYAQCLERIALAPERDIDVLFYGSANDRRLAVLRDLEARGVAVMHAFDCYGAARDALIARAKIVLNVHYYEAAVFESVRVSLLLANRACVVTEGDPRDPDVADLADGMAVCAYPDLVARCLALLADPAGRDALAERGHRRIAARPQAAFLAALFDGAPADDADPMATDDRRAAVA